MGQLENVTGMNLPLSLSWKIIIVPKLFKRVTEDLCSSSLGRKLGQMIQLIYSMLTTAPFTLKVTHLELLLYLSLKEFNNDFNTRSVKAINLWVIDLQVNWFRISNT